MSMSHITIKQKGQEPRPHRCHADATLFTCPFCSTDVCKPRQYHQIMTHIAGHKLRAVEYGDHVIYSCYIGCGKTTRHFHCCQCPKIYINKGALKKHLSNSHPIATCTLKPQPVSDPQQEPPSQQPASHPQQEPSSQKPASRPQQEPSSQKPASHPHQEPSSQKPASQPQQEPSSQKPASQSQQEPPSQKPASQSQQEPPSQKPASHPHQEPSSQKPASRPQQEPSSQKPASQPQQEPSSQKLQQEPSSQKLQQEPSSQKLQQEPLSQPPASHPQQEPSSQKPQQDPFSQKTASQSQQESSSQKPASHPQQEPSSQKTASHPQQEPPSQQPTSQPQEPSSQKPQQEPSSQQSASHPQQEPPSQKPQQEPSSQKPASQSQQEPPSQQSQQEPSSQKPQECSSQKPQKEPSSPKPASHPQEEPPSQQPASKPQEEPSSQQPASHPLQLAAPPAIKRISVQCRRRHITIKQKGQEPRPHRCHADATLFTCPFCSTDVCKPRQYHQIMTHIAGHKLRAVEYGDHVIYSCNLGCGKMARHFHCFQCPKTYINKSALKKHLCSSHPIATCALKPQPASDPQQEPSSQQPASHPQQECPSQQPASDPLQLAAPPAIKSHRRHITIKQRGQEPRPRRCHADATLFTCPFCSIDVCKPRQYHQIMTHIAGHKLRAVEYGDHVIYSCNLGCGKMARHFHCFQCPKTYINKADLKKHLCSSHPIATCALKPQPVSDPQQEPPSEQPASQPQQEPLEQPASPPLELADSPAIKRRQISVQCRRRHITIKQRGQEPRPHRCHADATLFTCPFCSTDVCKPRKYNQIMTHIAGHKLSAVEYGDDVIYSCNSCGEKARHFHCCQCPQTYFNQGALKRHLCNAHPIATFTPEPPPAGRPLQEPPLQQPAPRPLEVAAQRVIGKRKQISVQCPHCRVSLNSKNLKMHIKRKHHEAMHPRTSTWDSSHKVICDIDICKSCVETAPNSELLVTQCVSLSSSVDLSEDMLTEVE